MDDPSGGLRPPEPPARENCFEILGLDFDVFWLCFRAPPGSSHCRHQIGLVVAIRLHLTRALELNFKPRLGPDGEFILIGVPRFFSYKSSPAITPTFMVNVE